METKKEIWRPIFGFEGLYEVSNTKKVRSLDRVSTTWRGGTFLRRGKYLHPAKNKKTGYWYVVLCKNGKPSIHHLHKIVARAFPEICGEWFEGAVVNHKDWNINNNTPENLEVVTRKYNCLYRKPKPFVPKYKKRKTVYMENILSGERIHFKTWDECKKYLGMNTAQLIAYYIRTQKPYKGEFLIKRNSETDTDYLKYQQVNQPTNEQVTFYGIQP